MAQPDNTKLKRLIDKLKELFQLDQPELDFGIYRIMHAKSGEVTQFLEKDLLPQVREAFAQFQSADGAEAKKKLEQLIAQLTDAGVDPETSPKVQELRAKVASSVDIASLENEVYDHLYTFFRRYYSEGDFLSKRVYKEGVYAIPYEGEEVKLYWANHDQYYIKTSEYLRDYAFRLRPDDSADPMRVHFKLVDAAEGEHGNVKAAEGKERQFILAVENFIAEEAGELSLRFEYRPARVEDWPEAQRAGKDKPPSRDALIAIAEQRVFTSNELSIQRWLTEMQRPHTKADGEQAEYSRLATHLRRYTARHTFDYFIHKDLGGFLRRELDFYIKNEVMRLDDIESESAPKVGQYLSKIKATRRIAGKIIDFLAQLENFQKKLWLKKKFVVQADYCITLDRIPKAFYPDIAANALQADEWVRLFSIDEIGLASAEVQGDLIGGPNPAFSVPLTVEFLEANQFLPVDSSLFDVSFKERLLGSLDNLDEAVDGVLVHSDNFQALRLLEARYNDSVKCVYIDPPYNTASSSIPYKNDYKHSSFASMMFDRVDGLRRVLTRDGAIFVSIDKTERTIVQHVLDEVFGFSNRVEELIWVMNTNNSQAPNYSTNHEYVLVYAKDRPTAEQDRSMFREPKPGFEEVMDLVATLNPDCPPVSIIEAELRKLYERHRIELREEIEAQGLEWEDEKGNDPWKGLYNYSHAEYRDSDGNLVAEKEARERQAAIWIWQEDNTSMPATKQAASTRDPQHKNYRFYRPKHPVTGQPAPHPKSGWKFAYADDEDSPDKRSFVSLDRDGRIAWGPDESKVPRLKRMLHEVETNVGKSVFTDYSDGEKQTSAMFGKSGIFLAPKHANFVSRFILHGAKKDSTVLDCFGGSGSTAHAVIQLNRRDHGKRKYLLAEAAEYFDSVLKPRTLKAIYSPDWRAGKPVSRQGVSQCVKVIRLESYEDVLNNIEIRRSESQQLLLDASTAQSTGSLREDYLLRYQLDAEARGSQSLLNIDAFRNPTSYSIRVKRPGSDESRQLTVDLVETFNYLIGLSVHQIEIPISFSAGFFRDGEGRLRLKDRLLQQQGGPWWFRAVAGTSPDGRKTLIIWRNLSGDIEQDNLVLEEWFTKQGYSTKDSEFELIYVNGGNTLENLKTGSDTWKVRLIEEDFHRLMFDSANE
jgi:adenine-specific DNA-methyltransferase